VSIRVHRPSPGSVRTAALRSALSRATSGSVWLRVAWPVAVAGAGAGVAARPEIAVPALVGVLVLAGAVALPRTTVGLTLLMILFVRTLEHLVPISALGYLDEGLVVLCVVVLPLRRLVLGLRLRWLPGLGFFCVFAVFGLASGVVAGAAASTVLVGGFLLCKGWLFGWAVAQVDWAERHLRTAARFGAGVVVVSLVAVAANLAAPGPWSALLATGATVDVRFGLPSLIGPFVHPLDLGAVMAAAAVAVLAWRATVGRSAFTFVLVVGTCAATLLSFRRTAIAGLLVVLTWLRLQLRDMRALLVAAAAVPLLAVLLAGPLTTVAGLTYDDYVVGGDSAARTVLTKDAATLAVERFPLGAGFGRFGSETASTTYSPEYVARNYPAIYGLGTTAKTGQFLVDTEWPALLGETGLVGAAAFLAGLAAVYRRSRALWRADGPALLRWVGLTTAGLVVVSLIESVATVVFTGPPAYGPLFALAGVLAAVSDRAPAEPAEPEPEAEPVRTD
jgi:hypothetical protein